MQLETLDEKARERCTEKSKSILCVLEMKKKKEDDSSFQTLSPQITSVNLEENVA